jgi:hypothetical protein
MNTCPVRLLVLAPFLLAWGCATSLGNLPSPPGDGDLATDGSSEARKDVLRRYEMRPTTSPLLYWTGFDPVEMGDARRPSTGGVLDLDVQPELGAHLLASGMDLQPSLQRWRVAGYTAALGVLGVGAAWLAGIIIFNLVTLAGLPGMDAATGAALAGTVTSSSFVLLLLAVAVGSAVLLGSQFMVKRAVHSQLDAYNVRLRQRVDGAVQEPATQEPMRTVVFPPPPTPEGAQALPAPLPQE